MERYALMFRVKPGSESSVASILADYDRPATTIDETTRLLGTTVFMFENVVVRVIEVEGDLRRVVGHLAGQPQIQATEEALNPHLLEPRDLSDPAAARAFFQRAMMERLSHIAPLPDAAPETGAAAYAFLLPLSARHVVIEELFDGEGSAPSALSRTGPVRSATVFRHGDSLVLVLQVRGPLEEATGIPHLLEDRLMSVVTDRRAPQVA